MLCIKETRSLYGFAGLIVLVLCFVTVSLVQYAAVAGATIESSIVVTPSLLDFGFVSPQEQHTHEFSVRLSDALLASDDENGAGYSITERPQCKTIGEHNVCTEYYPDLCPYLSMLPEQKSENDTGIGSPHETQPYPVVYGDLMKSTDDTGDTWSLGITMPCVEGECPQGYNPALSGTPLPSGLKGETFHCNVTIEVTDTFGNGVARILPSFPVSLAHAFEGHTIEVTATVGITPTRFSNVAFFPGHGGSRLYGRDPGCIINCENQLWNPNFPYAADLQRLHLNTDGTPQDPSIYTRDIIDESFQDPQNWPGTNTYKTFMTFMDGLADKDNGIMNEWEALPYDWRFDFDTLLAKGEKIGDNINYSSPTSTPFIMQELERLAKTSATGKVTIVTHSNGGLFAKYFLEKLVETNNPLIHKIDKLIMVASPQLGTPKAVAVLLHGQFPAHIITRELVENMPSAYTLLPSERYFTDVSTPVMEFTGDTAVIPELSDLAGTSITSSTTLYDMLTGRGGKWSEPPFWDTDTPNVLKKPLLEKAADVHRIIDAWMPPQGIEVIQIAGWGLDTIRGITYDDCDIPFCSQTLNHLDRELNMTQDGDETVVIPSAVAMQGVGTYYVDLPKNNFIIKRNRRHSSIMEVTSVQEFIRNIIEGDTNVLPTNISSTKPTVDDAGKRLRYRIHSPVSLNLYDADGNHTGTVPNPDPTSTLHLSEEHIPNSYYLEFGDTKYAGTDSVGTTTLELTGQALGTFTLDIDEMSGDTKIATATFADIPTATSSRITMDIQTVATSTFLQMDVDGDGIIDVTIMSGEGVTTHELLSILKGLVKTLMLPDKKKESLVRRIEKLDKIIAKEYKYEEKKKHRLKETFEDITFKIRKLEKKGILTHEDTNELVSIIEQIKAGVIR